MKVLSYTQLAEVKGITYSRMHLARLMSAGKFPRNLQIGDHRIGWLEEEVDAWIAERASRRGVSSDAA